MARFKEIVPSWAAAPSYGLLVRRRIVVTIFIHTDKHTMHTYAKATVAWGWNKREVAEGRPFVCCADEADRNERDR